MKHGERHEHAASPDIPFDRDQTTELMPARTDDRYKNSQLTELGPAFLTFEEAGQTDQWILRYEEVLYVVTGELTLAVRDGERDYTVSGGEGDVITIAKGATVRYGGSKGTRVCVCFTPLNWQDLIG
jgi:ethanolamine utilization protein EutQ (cupin superfamily)